MLEGFSLNELKKILSGESERDNVTDCAQKAPAFRHGDECAHNG